jgi:hypothetical protein
MLFLGDVVLRNDHHVVSWVVMSSVVILARSDMLLGGDRVSAAGVSHLLAADDVLSPGGAISGCWAARVGMIGASRAM